MFGYGEYTIFKKVKKGTKYMLDDSTIVRAGLTKEESRRVLDKKLDNIVHKMEKGKVRKKILSLLKKG